MTLWKSDAETAARPLRPALALALALLAGCASAEGNIVSDKPVPASKAAAPAMPLSPKHKTFHYKTDSVNGVLGQWGQGTLDPSDSDNFANGVKYQCPGAGTLHVDSEVESDGTQLRVAVYTSGATPVAVTSKGEKLNAKIEQPGPCFVVVSAPNLSRECTFRLKATFTIEAPRP